MDFVVNMMDFRYIAADRLVTNCDTIQELVEGSDLHSNR